MATPNNIHKNSARKLILCIERVESTLEEANRVKFGELSNNGENYHMIKIFKFKTGAKPNKYNGFKQNYSYAIRAYKKP